MNRWIRSQALSAALAALTLLILSFSSIQSFAAPVRQGEYLEDVPRIYVYAEKVQGGSKVRILPSEYLLAAAPKTATITVSYPGTWDPEAKAAVEYAKGIWETQISSTVPILVEARWENMGAGVLGGAGANGYRRDFSGSILAETWFPLALANRLAGEDLDKTKVDIRATFNRSFSAWYFGTDGNPEFNEYDFVSVALHEIGHGLGFIGSMSVSSNGLGSWGWGVSSYPFIYDIFAANSSLQNLLTTYANNSTELGNQLQSGSLFFSGSQAVSANGSRSPKLYAPSNWEQGSSFSHLDENTYTAAGGNNLMTPSLANGEVIHLPGPVTLGIFKDIGWGTGPVVEATPTSTPTPTKTSTPTLPPAHAAPATSTPTPTYAYHEYFPSIHSSAPALHP